MSELHLLHAEELRSLTKVATKLRTDGCIKRIMELTTTIPLFTKINNEELHRETAKYLYYKHFVGGQTLFRQGDAPDFFFVILTGSVRVCVMDDDVVTLDKIMTEGSFGEVALLRNQKRSATVTTAEECEFLILTRADYLNCLNSHESSKLDRRMDILCSNIELFNWPRSFLYSLVCYMEDISFDEGEYLCRENDPGSSFMVIRSGTVNLTCTSSTNAFLSELAACYKDIVQSEEEADALAPPKKTYLSFGALDEARKRWRRIRSAVRLIKAKRTIGFGGKQAIRSEGLLQVGDVVGELAVLTGYKLRYNAIALTSVTVMFISKQDFVSRLTGSLPSQMKEHALLVRAAKLAPFMREKADLQVLINFTEGIRFFTTLNPVMHRQMCTDSEYLEFEKGQRLVEPKTFANAYYVILFGEVIIEEEEKPDVYLGAGHGFGEVSMADLDARFTFSVTALVPLQVLRFSRMTFLSRRKGKEQRMYLQKLRQLRNSALFRDVRDTLFQRMCTAFEQQTHIKPHVICREGTPCNKVMMICAGQCKVFRTVLKVEDTHGKKFKYFDESMGGLDEESRTVEVSLLGPGEFIGLNVLRPNAKYCHTVVLQSMTATFYIAEKEELVKRTRRDSEVEDLMYKQHRFLLAWENNRVDELCAIKDATRNKSFQQSVILAGLARPKEPPLRPGVAPVVSTTSAGSMPTSDFEDKLLPQFSDPRDYTKTRMQIQHITSVSRPHSAFARQEASYSRTRVDNLRTPERLLAEQRHKIALRGSVDTAETAVGRWNVYADKPLTIGPLMYALSKPRQGGQTMKVCFLEHGRSTPEAQNLGREENEKLPWRLKRTTAEKREKLDGQMLETEKRLNANLQGVRLKQRLEQEQAEMREELNRRKLGIKKSKRERQTEAVLAAEPRNPAVATGDGTPNLRRSVNHAIPPITVKTLPISSPIMAVPFPTNVFARSKYR